MIHNAIAKFVVENGFDGYEVELATGSATLLWQGMIQGDVDLDIEEWTENMPTYHADVARGDIIPLGELVPDSAQGFYVPRYVIEGDKERGIEPMAPDLKTVSDLAKYAHVFIDPEDSSKARIYGPIPGWEIDNTMYKKYQHYKLDEAGYIYFRVGSEPVLFTSLMSAYNLGEPWVGYMYEPSWIAGKLDLVILEDVPYDPKLYTEGACEIPRQALMNLCSRYFPERAPDLVDFFKNYKTGLDRISAALAYLEDTKESHAKTAIWFMKTYDNLLDEWLTPEQAKKVRDALAKH
jgi:glycine betaine/proline transport system permease protein/glycine betaine/proline transport system substrate-binding protein